jgi:hypothetical protein
MRVDWVRFLASFPGGIVVTLLGIVPLLAICWMFGYSDSATVVKFYFGVLLAFGVIMGGIFLFCVFALGRERAMNILRGKEPPPDQG